jgi:hypothetical protein
MVKSISARDFCDTATRLQKLLVLVVPLLLSGCATYHYSHTPIGKLTGKVVVEWYKPNLFVYRPDATDPLTFLRSNGDIVKPERMLTDGGSIPRPFWVFKNYSPWGYGPAFVAHDWLFRIKNCNLPGYKPYDLSDAARVMSEIMKTLMESPGFDYGSKTSMYLMYEAVQTPPAIEAWEHGACQNIDILKLPVSPDAVFHLDFGTPPR